MRLLQTVAASMGVALENARLFDETQRLFKETEQRAAELASSTAWAATCRRRSTSHGDWTAIARQATRAVRRPTTARSSCPTRDGHDLPRHRRDRRDRGRDHGDRRRRRRGHHRQPAAKRPSRAHQRTPRPIRAASRFAGTRRSRNERLMVVPLLRGDGAVEGAMAVWRTGGAAVRRARPRVPVGSRARPTVALQNARLFNETQEALEQPDGDGRDAARDQQLDRPTRSRCSTRSLQRCEHLFAATESAIVAAARRRPARHRRRLRSDRRRGAAARSDPQPLDRDTVSGPDPRAATLSCIADVARPTAGGIVAAHAHGDRRSRRCVSRRCCATAARSGAMAWRAAAGRASATSESRCCRPSPTRP